MRFNTDLGIIPRVQVCQTVMNILKLISESKTQVAYVARVTNNRKTDEKNCSSVMQMSTCVLS